ncbi:hypothetical protein GWC95_15595 [Sediminibacterium roseum]|uniref:Uncharacterized protein n=1 Tax=Sediminibacterium roseum TaxID=1978412 RepID=A0ABW9ZYH8_9BACT|nr:hypothetical protein [Sediminibacterium roseum]NCI51352.1 hypothetical protein [Sediminibacterium roseum]
MVQQINTTQRLSSGSIMIKSPDGGKTGTKYQVHFFAGLVRFTTLAGVYLKADNTTDEISITDIPAALDTIDHFEDYLAHHNTALPLYKVVA